VEALMENVTIQNNAFLFCRYGVAVLIWVALLLQSVYVLWAVFAILALSALLKVERAPMVWSYTNTLGRFVASKDVILDVRAMRFAHTSGAVLAAVALVLVTLHSPLAWPFVGVFALLKTVSALGFCPAYKIYGCAAKGGCCALTGKQ
jgi:hypothetical protein